MTAPVFLVIAGPNGSGKTTITARLRADHWSEGVEYLNPDDIARDRFGDWNSPSAVRSAAEFVTARREALLGVRQSLASSPPSSSSARSTRESTRRESRTAWCEGAIPCPSKRSSVAIRGRSQISPQRFSSPIESTSTTTPSMAWMRDFASAAKAGHFAKCTGRFPHGSPMRSRRCRGTKASWIFASRDHASALITSSATIPSSSSAKPGTSVSAESTFAPINAAVSSRSSDAASSMRTTATALAIASGQSGA